MGGLNTSRKGEKLSTHICKVLVFIEGIMIEETGSILERSESYLIVPFLIVLDPVFPIAISSRYGDIWLDWEEDSEDTVWGKEDPARNRSSYWVFLLLSCCRA